VPILVPPLRERAEDIPEIADYLLRRIASELKISRRSLHPDVLRRLMSYSFPGNIREFRNLLERACILANDSEIDWIDLPEPAAGSTSGNSCVPNIVPRRVSPSECARNLGTNRHRTDAAQNQRR
jgi:DNA-binding NtrC family response regulator